ncbi:uncharacterized protein BDZ99DRAFT_539136 [Mytilinidion resinicola]|uniref:Mid2 domain-containing protein n=1 Tax=Mytilinidion resinicola TaxID=574789 RepID=A0A6A6YAN3_9PEZI|nr:uncharacterized protein BDZ99DRAFT_539136 [Mytilinidion resinicola]KAF2805881.1 hypothetical protein BDZ99DRAFT_539136 [Mytilinidion resinicola]
MPMSLSLLLSLLALSNAVHSQGQGTCYTPQGVPTDGQQACNPYQQVSSCCPSGTTCFSNQLCILTDPEEVSDTLPLGAVLRGSCTNPLWSNSICGSFCLGNGDNGSITSCGNQQYCCQSGISDGSCDCDTGKGIFSLADGVAQTIIGVSGLEATTIPPVSRASSKAIASTTASSVTATSSSKSPTTLASSTQRSSSHASPTATATATESSPSQTSPAAAPSLVHTTRFKIGLGVGLGVGIPILISIGILIWWWLSHHNKRNPPPNRSPYDTNSDTHPDDPRLPNVSQPDTAPNPNPYDLDGSAVGSYRSPVATPPPQARPGQSRDVLGTAPTNNPYESTYSLRSRAGDTAANPYPNLYGPPQHLERVGETSVPQGGIELNRYA